SRGGIKAIQPAGGALRINLASMEHGRGARTRPRHRFGETRRVSVCPSLSAGVGIVTDHQFVFASLLLRIKVLSYHGERRPAGTDRMAPDEPRRLRLPIGSDANTL